MNLNLFCNDPGGQYDVDRPFVLDGWQYATNGRIAVRVPTDMPDSDGRYPDVAEFFGDFPDCDRSWPEFDRSPLKCTQCLRGRVPQQCKICDGTGEHTCQCGSEHTCGKCDGEGEVASKEECPWCKGEVVVIAPEGDTDRFVRLDGHQFAAWYLWLIESNVGNLHYTIRDKILYFAGVAGVQGAVVSWPMEDRK